MAGMLFKLVSVFFLFNFGYAGFMSICTMNEKMYSFWLVLDCTHDFHLNDIVLLEEDVISSDDFVASFTPEQPILVKKFMLLHFNAVLTDDSYGNDYFSFKFNLNSTCNSRSVFEISYSESQGANCTHTVYGPHPVIIMAHIDRETTAIDFEEAY
ncbi:unnamed protein product [Auanema sp. JU1783]|nr:unnamed protein product [Auanema sp. JU1783]